MAVTDCKASLVTLLSDSLAFQSVEAAFFGFIIHEEDDEKKRIVHGVESFKKFWNSLNSEQKDDKLIGEFVSYANKQRRFARLTFLYELLKAIVEDQIIPARNVCEALLSAEELKFSNADIWRQSFKFIRHFLPQMDYKSVRAVFSNMLIQVKIELPEITMGSQTYQIDDVRKIVMMGLDRNALLLPSYFVVNDIYKLYPSSNFRPHWALGKEFTAFVNSFKALAQMVSITGHSLLLPVVGHSGSSNVWNLEPSTLKFPLKGPLPYEKSLIQPQQDLLRYVIAQPYSRDMVCSMLGLKRQQKQRCEALEDLLVDLIIVAMEKTENINDGDESHQLLWQHLSSQLIFFILFQFASFSHMLLSLHDKLLKRNLNKGRDHLMWVLLQFISGSIQKSPLSVFSPVMKLFDLLYPEKTPLPVPVSIDHDSNICFAMTCIWVHLSKKAQIENKPIALRSQIEHLEKISKQKLDGTRFEIALLCNAYSTNQESFQLPLQELLTRCYGNGQNITQLGSKGVLTATNTIPLDMKLLDSLTVHAKMSLIQGIVKHIIQVAQTIHQQQQPIALAPALVETYSRLLVYMEIELLGIKGFISQLLPTVLMSKSWGILHTLAEMFSFRLHHIQPHYRVNLLSHLHSLLMVPFTEKSQLHICVQHAAVRLITGFDNSDMHMQLSTPKILADPKQMLSKDCEELNRVLILTIARAVKVTSADGLNLNWCEGILKTAMEITPHRWFSATVACFPSSIQKFYLANSPPQDPNSCKVLAEKVEKHFRKIKTFTKDEEMVTYCTDTEGLPEIFLCIMWKILVEQNRVTTACYYVLMKLRPKAISNYLNNFSDFVVFEMIKLINSSQQQQLTRMLHLLNDVIWKYDIIPMDRLLLSLVLRPHEDKEAQIGFVIIKFLLLQPQEFKSRVKKFTSENKSQHWNQSNWHEKHKAYHEQFPENFCYEGILAANNLPAQQSEYLPTYFGNVCLRFLPVFDIIIHRCIESPPPNTAYLESLLQEYGCIFKFHDRPISYLYNTLHYYEHKLRDHPRVKKSLVSVVINSQLENHPSEWACSKEYLEYMKSNNESWVPDQQYFVQVIGRFVDSIANKIHPPPYPPCDWRFNEFPNLSAHALHATCVELMALPLKGEEVGRALVDVLCTSTKKTNVNIRTDIMSWINAAALLFTSLPEPYMQVVNQKVCEVVQNTLPQVLLMSTTSVPSFFDFFGNHSMNCETYPDYILAIFHVTWLHASVGQFTKLTSFLKDTLKPLITTEAQLLYVMCLYGPFLQRFFFERLACILEICGEFYSILEQVCRHTTNLVFVDVISDFLYHIKYMFVGDNLRNVIAQTLDHLHEPLQRKLKFMISPPKREDSSSGFQQTQQYSTQLLQQQQQQHHQQQQQQQQMLLQQQQQQQQHQQLLQQQPQHQQQRQQQQHPQVSIDLT